MAIVTYFVRGGQNFVTLCDTGGGEGVEITPSPKPRDILNGQPLSIMIKIPV